MVSQTMVNALRRVTNMMIQKEFKERENELEVEMEQARETIKSHVLHHLISRNATVVDAFTNEDGSVTVTLLPLDSREYRHYTELLDEYRDMKLEYQKLLEKLEIWYGIAMVNKDNLVKPPELPDDLKPFIIKAKLFLEE